MGGVCCFFFFKQKSAYEMRISDWSSDVCSSALKRMGSAAAPATAALPNHQKGRPATNITTTPPIQMESAVPRSGCSITSAAGRPIITSAGQRAVRVRSEEHTSELQSLMRISYAVFCLKKKTILAQKHTKQT